MTRNFGVLSDGEINMVARGKLHWLELGRGAAALAVLICHGSETGFPPSLSFVASWGDWGVCFFFVLSGFIIHHVHSADIGRPHRASQFAWKRFLRIFPTYWLILSLAIFANRYVGNPDFSIDVDIKFLLRNYLLLPGGTLFVSPAWTLRHEVLFYGLFLFLVATKRLGILLFCLWFFAIVFHIQSVGFDDGSSHPVVETLAGYRNLFFFAGMAISEAARRENISPAAGVLGALSLAAGVLSLYYEFVPFALMQLLLCSLVVALFVRLSEDYDLPSVVLWLGAISYPLYLVHRLSLTVAHGLLKRAGVAFPAEWLLQFLIGFVVAVVAAHVIHVVFEKKIVGSLRRIELWVPARKYPG